VSEDEFSINVCDRWEWSLTGWKATAVFLTLCAVPVGVFLVGLVMVVGWVL
jgi:hypothetical protein